MKRLLILLASMSLIIGAGSVYAQCNVTYDRNTGHLSIPRVQVYFDGTPAGDFDVEMQDEGDPFQTCFRVIKADLIDDSTVTKTDITSDSILERIRERESLLCGGRTDLPGFGYTCQNGRNCGFDIDLCRAVAAAVLDSPKGPITFIPVSTDERRKVLKEGTVDMLSRNTTWTSSRDADWGNFTWVMFYDGQGFMVRKDSGISTIAELDNKRICVVRATTTFRNLEDEFARRNLTPKPVFAEETSELMPLYIRGDCDAVTTDKSGLIARRAGLDDHENHKILDIIISEEPLAPVVPHGDEQWLDIVKIVMFGLIHAEKLGITQANVDAMMNSDNPKVKLLLGVEGDFGQGILGLEKDALAQAIRAVGNYGEIYERHLGPNGVDIPRGPNHLRENNGFLYAPPIR